MTATGDDSYYSGMANKLENRVSWSFSRAQTFGECRRKYYYTYYLSWHGWERDAPLARRNAYMLKNMTNLPMWSGGIVHDVLAHVLEQRRHGRSVALPQAEKMAVHLLRRGWKDSKEQLWKENAKRFINLFEHYYRVTIPKDRTDDVKSNVLACVRNFYGTDAYSFAQVIDREDFRQIEELRSFVLDDITIFFKIDFAFEHAGRIRLYDWKSGQPGKHDELQTALYALFASREWAVDPEDVVVALVYLLHSREDRIAVGNAEVEDLKVRIHADYTDFLSCLRDAEKNEAAIEDFPMTEQNWRCRRCNFRELCYPDGIQEEPDQDDPFADDDED